MVFVNFVWQCVSFTDLVLIFIWSFEFCMAALISYDILNFVWPLQFHFTWPFKFHIIF